MIGRIEEQRQASKYLQSKKAELLLVTGRRRVGKTYFIREVFKQQLVFEFVGTIDAETNNQLRKFESRIEYHFLKRKKCPRFDHWFEAFEYLSLCLEKNIGQKRVVFFDEFPWIATQKSGFLSEFEYWWNTWASKQNIIVVVSGSATSWMLKNIRDNRKGLYNRVTKYIHLEPFTLSECQIFLQCKGIRFDIFQLLQLYMVMGGIPHYLEDIERGESVAQIINRICFSKNGLLKNEFSNLYAAIFDRPENYIAVVKSLSTKRQGMTRQQIIAATGIPDGGGLTKVLTELETCSFILRINAHGNKVKDSLYRLLDEYTLFYFTFMQGKNSTAKDVWLQKHKSQSFSIWQGYAFENLCMRHIAAIRMALGISGIYTAFSSFYRPANAMQKGLQIDMIIDRSDNTMNLCEMKFYSDIIVLNETATTLLRQRRTLFTSLSKTRKMLFNTLITTYGLHENQYAVAQVDQVVTMDKLLLLNHF